MTAQVSQCCGAPAVPERLGTCTRCGEHTGFDATRTCATCLEEIPEADWPGSTQCYRCQRRDEAERKFWGFTEEAWRRRWGG